MKLVKVTDAAGKPIKVALLTDWDLLYCIPYALLSYLTQLAYDLYLAIIRPVIIPAAVLFTKSNVSLFWLMGLFPLLIALASAITATAGPYSVPDFAAAFTVFVVGATILAKIFANYMHLEGAPAPAGANPSPREAAAVARIREEAASLPDACVRRPWDKAILYIGFLRTMMVLPALVWVVFLPASWLNHALIAYIAVFLFNDFENIEHVSSHSPSGELMIAKHAPWWARVAELLRRYIVWPAFGWFPDKYFLTHAMHHHVENNGPADWQSTIRYDRTSVLEFTKAATWLGLNLWVPIDTLCYLVQRRRWRLLRMLVQGLATYLLLLTIVALTEPALFVILAASVALSGVGSYKFVMVWHGFHDPTQPYDVAAANQSLGHYAHHADRRVHLKDIKGLARVVREIDNPSSVIVLRPEFMSWLQFWRLQALLWKKDFAGAADGLVEHNTVTKEDMAGGPFELRKDLVGRGVDAATMQRLASSFFPLTRAPWLQRWDDRLSRAIGSITGGRRAPLDEDLSGAR